MPEETPIPPMDMTILEEKKKKLLTRITSFLNNITKRMQKKDIPSILIQSWSETDKSTWWAVMEGYHDQYLILRKSAEDIFGKEEILKELGKPLSLVKTRSFDLLYTVVAQLKMYVKDTTPPVRYEDAEAGLYIKSVSPDISDKELTEGISLALHEENAEMKEKIKSLEEELEKSKQENKHQLAQIDALTVEFELFSDRFYLVRKKGGAKPYQVDVSEGLKKAIRTHKKSLEKGALKEHIFKNYLVRLSEDGDNFIFDWKDGSEKETIQRRIFYFLSSNLPDKMDFEVKEPQEEDEEIYFTPEEKRVAKEILGLPAQFGTSDAYRVAEVKQKKCSKTVVNNTLSKLQSTNNIKKGKRGHYKILDKDFENR